MKTGKRVMITASIVIAVLATGVVTSYAWLKSTDDKEGDSMMGAVEVEIAGEFVVDSEGVAGFEIINKSTIDTFVRLGWTPVYMNSAGEITTEDVTGIGISSVELTGSVSGLDGMVPAPQTIISYGGYEKNMIVMEEKEGERKGKYFVVPANTGITGKIKVDTSILNDDYKLQLILVPEAIQATEKAVEEANGYGWTKSKVGKQALYILKEAGSNG